MSTRGWIRELKVRFPMTKAFDADDARLWTDEIKRMVGDTKPGELAETVVWASYNFDNQKPVTPQDLVFWVRKRRFENSEIHRNKALIADNARRNEISEAGAKVIREWLIRNGRHGNEDGYRRVMPDEVMEPTDEYLSAIDGRWHKLEKMCELKKLRYKHVRRKIENAEA